MRYPLLPSISAALVSTLFAAPLAFAQSPSAKLILSEDFESTPVGEVPQGFTKAGKVGVADDAAHSGKKSLKMEPAINGARRITKEGPEIAALGGEHWGRLYYKVKLPAPLPVVPEGKTSAVIHSTLVSGMAKSPLFNDIIEVRPFGSMIFPDGGVKYLYNVQPKGARKEFATTTKTISHYTDEWTLVEWHVDYATQTYQFFVNGEEIPDMALHKGAGNFEGAEIPAVFDNLSFGWTNYQPAGEGFVSWIDDIALSKERIGPTPVALKK
jgi:hypothetical protein